MVRSKPKREKREETTEEFVKRINQHKGWGKRNGTKRGPGRHHRWGVCLRVLVLCGCRHRCLL